MTSKARAELILLATTIVWGSTFVVVKIGLEEFSAFLFVAIRFLLAALFFLLFFRKKIFPMSASVARKGSLLGLLLFIGFITQTIGLNHTTASKSAFITGMMVALVPLLQIFITRKPPKVGNIVGILLVVIGLLFLTSPEESAFNFGDAITIVCAVAFAVYIVYLDVVSREMTALQLTFLQIASNAVLATIGVFVFESVAFNTSFNAIAALLYLTIFATIITVFVQTNYQKDTTPTRAVIIFSIEPVIASVLAYFFLGEVLGPLGLLGGGLIVGGVLVSELSDSIPGLNKSVGGFDA
ncbi:MAG: DMT family transporter [Bacteroidota bacterium]